MVEDFQQIIDTALKDVPITSVWDEIHFQPIAEEGHRAQILRACSKRPAPQTDAPRVHVGVAGGFNFDVVCITRPARMLLLDNNEAQARFWHEVIGLLKECDNANDFTDRIFTLTDTYAMDRQLTYQSPAERGAVLSVDRIMALREAEDSFRYYPLGAQWLEPDNYAYLHQLACDGHIAIATLDITKDTQAAQALGAAMRHAGLTTDTCYWSNIASTIEPMHSMVNARESVFRRDQGGLSYGAHDYYTCKNNGIDPEQNTVQWDGSDTRNMPLFEHMLRNISTIGADAHSTHMLANVTGSYPLILTDGPPRDPSNRREQWRERHLKEQGVEPKDRHNMER